MISKYIIYNQTDVFTVKSNSVKIKNMLSERIITGKICGKVIKNCPESHSKNGNGLPTIKTWLSDFRRPIPTNKTCPSDFGRLILTIKICPSDFGRPIPTNKTCLSDFGRPIPTIKTCPSDFGRPIPTLKTCTLKKHIKFHGERSRTMKLKPILTNLSTSANLKILWLLKKFMPIFVSLVSPKNNSSAVNKNGNTFSAYKRHLINKPIT